MIPVACGSCRTVAPLIARYNDPDLGEAERVLLSTHLLQCPHCLAQLQEYRALDQRLRRISGVTLSPQVREAVLERIAAPGPGFGPLGFAPVGRHAWLGAATVLSLTALVVIFSLSTFNAAQQADGMIAQGGTTNEALARPLTTTILGANPTQVANTVGGSLSGTVSGTVAIGALRSAPASTVHATVREVHTREGYIIVLIDGARQEERLLITGDTAIRWSDGRPASLADLATGVAIQIQRDQPLVGGPVALRITLSR